MIEVTREATHPIWNQAHLLRALHEYEQFHNEHRPHRGLANARPLHPLPEPITEDHTTPHPPT